MKANTTVPRIYNLFQHPSKRFTDAVGTIADQRIINYHTEHGNGYSEEEIIAIVQEQLATTDPLTYGGSIEDPTAEGILVADNVGKIYNSTNSFTATAESTIFVETFEAATTFPAGVNLLVVNVGTAEEPVYRFDILAGIVSSSSGLLKFDSAAGTVTIPEEYHASENFVSATATVKVKIGEDVIFSGHADGVCSVTIEGDSVMVQPLDKAWKMFADEADGINIEVQEVKIFLQC
ncbi:MAG: hypothetical protein IK032_03735 [Bacteroidales bacterium]|nr:hypothetical protein [Bacteroidales bacterium]MBR5029302.1 hypothetical protein [Bacteroidales bacterium]